MYLLLKTLKVKHLESIQYLLKYCLLRSVSGKRWVSIWNDMDFIWIKYSSKVSNQFLESILSGHNRWLWLSQVVSLQLSCVPELPKSTDGNLRNIFFCPPERNKEENITEKP